MEQENRDENWFYNLSIISLFVVSMVCLGLEILLTRIFSVVLFASQSFMAISLTLLGTGSGAIVAYLGKRLSGPKAANRLVAIAILMALCVGVSSFSLLQVEFVPQDVIDPDTGETNKDLSFRQRRDVLLDNQDIFDFWKLYGMIPVAFLPFFFAGYLQAFVFRSFSKKFPFLYGVDLFGAVLGSIAMPLLIYPLGLVGTLAVMVVITLLPAFYALTSRMRSWKVAAACLVPIAAFTGLYFSGQFRVKYAAGFKEKGVVREYWSPMARVSLRFRGKKEMYVIDNGSRSFYVPKTAANIASYDRSLYAVPFEVKRGGSVLIIASGGGQEITMASHYDFKRIDAVEIARPIITDILRFHKDDPGNPYLLPNVRYFVADGRSVAMRSREKYDVIEMLEVNFHTVAGQISQAWSPYLVFTQEAFSEYMEHLQDDGYLCYSIFSKGKNPVSGNMRRRFCSIIAGMRIAGMDDPQNHIVIMARPYTYGYRTMVLAKKSEFTPQELATMRELLAARGPQHEILYPDMAPVAAQVAVNLPEGYKLQQTTNYIDRIDKLCRETKPFTGLQANLMSRKTLTINHPINDNRPYMTGSGVWRTRKPDPAEELIGDLYKNLFIIMGALGFIFIAVPFIVSRPGGGQRVRINLRLFLILVFTGVGFMFLEMAGIYKYQLYLHHPTYAMIVVLASMILGAGLGSTHSGRIAATGKYAAIFYYAIAAIAAAAGVLIVIPIFGHKIMLAMPFALLALLISLFFCGFGFILGHIVPLSVSAYAKDQENLLCWCWAITVTGGVLGTVCASIVSRDFGIFVVSLIGTLCYLGVVLVGASGLIFKPRDIVEAEG